MKYACYPYLVGPYQFDGFLLIDFLLVLWETKPTKSLGKYCFFISQAILPCMKRSFYLVLLKLI